MDNGQWHMATEKVPGKNVRRLKATKKSLSGWSKRFVL